MPFHNPYNFIPATPRDTNHAELGDHKPPAHGWLAPELYTGVLKVKMTCVTPLILLDHLNVRVEVENGHKTYPVRTNPDGSPGLSPTAIKGMLSNAFEIVTNSRWRVFHGWNKRLSYRSDASEALELVPAVVLDNGDIQLQFGCNDGLPVEVQTRNGPALRPPGNLMYAAFLPTNIPAGLPAHRQRIRFWTQRFRRGTTFEYDRVLQWEDASAPHGPAPLALHAGNGNHQPVNGSVDGPFDGIACVTGHNIGGKHFERVIFGTGPVYTKDSPEGKRIIESYQDLVKDYQRAHEPDDGRRAGVASMPGTVFSRHVGFNGTDRADRAIQRRERELQPGDVLYVRMDFEGKPGMGYPVHISREPFEEPVASTLHRTLRPATSLGQLSPADRVFGWVHATRGDSKDSAYKGNLRVTNVACAQPANAIEVFDRPSTLAILGTPKPTYARFYCGDDQEGTPFTGRRDTAYSRAGQNTKGPRGRKVYPHQPGAPQDLAFAGDATNQNASVTGWVKEQTEFTFDIHVKNLNRMELGALVFILSMQEGRYLKLGYAKPLGFGSVRLELDSANSAVALGSVWGTYFSDLSVGAHAAEVDLQTVRKTFLDAHQPLPEYLVAFRAACQGFPENNTVRYPGTGDEDGFAWFVENEGSQQPQTLAPLDGTWSELNP